MVNSLLDYFWSVCCSSCEWRLHTSNLCLGLSRGSIRFSIVSLSGPGYTHSILCLSLWRQDSDLCIISCVTSTLQQAMLRDLYLQYFIKPEIQIIDVSHISKLSKEPIQLPNHRTLIHPACNLMMKAGAWVRTAWAYRKLRPGGQRRLGLGSGLSTGQAAAHCNRSWVSSESLLPCMSRTLKVGSSSTSFSVHPALFTLVCPSNWVSDIIVNNSEAERLYVQVVAKLSQSCIEP